MKTGGSGNQRFKAIIWRADDGKPGERVEIMSSSLREAEKELEALYGVGCVFDLHNEEDAARPR